MVELRPLERRTALLVHVPVAEPVDAFRHVHLAATVARGLPAHITVLFPFAPAADMTAEFRAQVAAHFASFERFDATLARVRHFDAHVWLAPEPETRFVELFRGTYTRFPAFPPYGDAHGEPVPHLTIAEVAAGETIVEVADAAARWLVPGLPFGFSVDRVDLFEEGADGAWQHADSFELG